MGPLEIVLTVVYIHTQIPMSIFFHSCAVLKSFDSLSPPPTKKKALTFKVPLLLKYLDCYWGMTHGLVCFLN